ncbi:peptidoglycan-binding protein [Roseivivax sp. GX 12232]|uniref:peptidoglycan-binding domain-containing protein n=1 Tax=Roseivivax sp. GX 12232 TaxID=2900547 RepID=UPI001E314063|nr:peptidoglycan-binding domain-containing protein [Roseivivax sp. GX 12232]MCE0504346.1 peptidoglycan-binding protein [Roseivivax sp. GX 12232]
MFPKPARTACLVTTLALAACAPAGPGEEASARPGFNTMGLGDDDSRPAPEGGCYATERVPAVYAQVPGQVQVVQAERDAEGNVTAPPVYRNTLVPKLVRPREEMRFPAPCPPVFTPEFIASVQRALSARGLYAGPVTSRMDARTRAAIRSFQEARGLESDKLALETARELGLVAVELPGTEG